MGKAAVDLPDPLETPSDSAKTLTSTDELLAQLAGEEIDRLLAEVDDQAALAAAPLPPRANAALSRPIDLDGTPDPAAAAPPPTLPDDEAAGRLAAAPDQPDVTAELDAFFKSAVHPPADATASASSDAVDATPAVQDPEVSPSTEPLETSAAERAGLNAPAPDPAPQTAASAAPTPIPAAPQADDAEVLPLYLKPLEWINAPLTACPSALRDFIGKAAIITLVNAAAVLVYVMLFRRS